MVVELRAAALAAPGVFVDALRTSALVASNAYAASITSVRIALTWRVHLCVQMRCADIAVYGDWINFVSILWRTIITSNLLLAIRVHRALCVFEVLSYES